MELVSITEKSSVPSLLELITNAIVNEFYPDNFSMLPSIVSKILASSNKGLICDIPDITVNLLYNFYKKNADANHEMLVISGATDKTKMLATITAAIDKIKDEEKTQLTSEPFAEIGKLFLFLPIEIIKKIIDKSLKRELLKRSLSPSIQMINHSALFIQGILTPLAPVSSTNIGSAYHTHHEINPSKFIDNLLIPYLDAHNDNEVILKGLFNLAA